MSMPNKPSAESSRFQDDTYLAIWKSEQEHVRHRWTVATFFISISFAIFGFSLQNQATQATLTLALVQRIAAVVIYWFAYIFFLQFNRYTDFLRGYLREMETNRLTSLALEAEASQRMRGNFSKFLGAKWLLLYFGLLYSGAVVVLRLFGV